MTARAKAFFALLLSMLIPGLGQIYNREQKKGWVIIACCLVLGIAAYWLSGFNALTAALALLLIWLSAIVDAYKVATSTGQSAEFFYAKSYVITMLLLVGPLALPLLWQSPNFTNTARWLWTLIVVGAALLFVVTPYLLQSLLI
jgi:TM2 domain-containing membrane protein YozV